MNNKEFLRTIKIMDIPPTSDTKIFLHKSHLDMLLKGGKIRKNAVLHSKFSITPFHCASKICIDALEHEEKISRERMIGKFEDMIREKKFIEESEREEYYDEEDKLLETDDFGNPIGKDGKEPIISKKVSIKSITENFLDDSIDIKGI